MSRVRRIAKELGLPDTGQDWGIEHADPSRLLEFIEFAESLVPENEWEMEALAELVLQSTEEALEASSLSDGVRRRVVAFLQSRSTAFPASREHWSRYAEHEGWHIGSILRAAWHVP